MKKYLLILAMFGFVLYGCDKTPEEVEDDTTQTTPENPDDQQPGDDTEVPHFAITGDGAFAIPFGGGEFEVAVETNLEYTVAIPENAKSWVSVKATRTLRTETVIFAVAANADNEERSTSVTFIDENGQTLQTITVKQEAKPEEKEPNESEDPNDPEEPEKPQFGITGEVMFAMPAEGGEFEVAVETNLEYTVVISEDAQPWVALKETRALRTETLVFEVAANDDSEERSAAIAFIGEDGKTLQTIAIKQEAAPEEDEPEEESIPLNEIHYTTTDGEIVEPYRYNFGEGVNLVSNTYENGEGIMVFDNPVTEIGNFAFYNCDRLTSITIPNNVTAIGDWAFNNCTSLTDITIPDSVTEIGDYAFYNCTSLTSITIPNNVTEIGNFAFYNCSSLTSIAIPESIIKMGNGAFSACRNISEFKGKFAFDNGRCLIIDGILNSFAPAGLTEYTIPDGVTTIGPQVFIVCTELIHITIPDSVTIIGSQAFSYCPGLTSIIIPEGTTSIELSAFMSSTSLESVYCKALTPPSLDYMVFEFNADGRKIYVPYQSLDAYKTAEVWRTYANDIVPYDFENDIIFDIDAEINGEKVELTVDQLSSPYTAEYDGYGIPALVDGDIATYWHSVFGDTAGDETYGYYIDIALDEPLNHFCFRYCTRHNNTNAVPALVTIGGSHDGNEWTVLATDLMCYARDREQWAVIEAIGSASAEAYEYLRFGVTKSAGDAGGNLKGETNGKYLAMSELQLYKLTE